MLWLINASSQIPFQSPGVVTMETESPYPCDQAENGTAVPDPNFRPEDAQHEGKVS